MVVRVVHMVVRSKLSQLVIIAAATTLAKSDPEGRIPLTRTTKTTYYAPAKVAYGSFQSFGGHFGSQAGAISPAIPLAPTVQSFAGSFVHTGDGYPRHDYYHHDEENLDNNFPRPGENVPPIGENFLRINHNHNRNFPQQEENFPSQQEENFPPQQEQNFPQPQERQNFPQPQEKTTNPPPTERPPPQRPQNPPQQAQGRQNIPQSRPNALPVAPLPVAPLPVVPPAADRRQGTPAFRAPSNNLEQILEEEWTAFKSAFNKTYSSFEEERQRREIFIENRNKVSRFNQEYGSGRHSFVQKLNQYADLLNHEFNQQLNGLNRTRRDGNQPERRPSAFISSANVQLPSYVDWREAGAVTPVRSQGSCGACYAFAAAGALEGQVYRKTGRLQELSPQNLIDCTESYTNNGCTGGLMEFAFEYVKDNRGIDTESAYPFEGRDGQDCRYRQDGFGAQVTGYVIIDEGDEGALEMAVATLGPVAIGIDAHADSFQFYSNGVYVEPLCSSDLNDINHAVLVVGYGTEPNGQQYWLIKNSYGPEWGIGGYMKMAKNSNNQCAVASYATYPLI